MAFSKEASMGVGQGQRTWQVPPLTSLWVWHGMRTENHSTEREAAEAGKSFRAKPKTGVSPESPCSLASKAAQRGRLPSGLSLQYSWHLFKYCSCWHSPWRDSNNSKQYLTSQRNYCTYHYSTYRCRVQETCLLLTQTSHHCGKAISLWHRPGKVLVSSAMPLPLPGSGLYLTWYHLTQLAQVDVLHDTYH